MTSGNDLEVKIAKLEERIIGHENRIKNLEEDSDILPRLATLMEVMTENQKTQQLQISEQHETLVEINTNLSGMNKELKDLSGRVSKVEESQDNGFDWNDVVKKIIPSILGGLILAWLVVHFKLK